MKSLVILGAIIALLGLIAFAIPSFSTHETKEVAKIGDLKLQANTEQEHFIPPLVSEGMILLGVLIIGAGVLTSRQS